MTILLPVATRIAVYSEVCGVCLLSVMLQDDYTVCAASKLINRQLNDVIFGACALVDGFGEENKLVTKRQ